MKKILVPIDGSGAALRALEQAVALARLSGASLEIVHAHEEPDIYGQIAVYVPREKMAELQRSHSEGLLQNAETAIGKSGVQHNKAVVIGPLGQAIARHAESTGCDLIVMGRHGKSALANVVMGSVAMKVLHASQLPVMLVR